MRFIFCTGAICFVCISLFFSEMATAEITKERLDKLLSYFPNMSYMRFYFYAATEFSESEYLQIYSRAIFPNGKPKIAPDTFDLKKELKSECDYMIKATVFDIVKSEKRYAMADPEKGIMPPSIGLDEELLLYEITNAKLFLTELVKRKLLENSGIQLNSRAIYSTQLKHNDVEERLYLCAIETDTIIGSGSEKLLRRMAAAAEGKVDSILLGELYTDIMEYAFGSYYCWSVQANYLMAEKSMEVSEKRGQSKERIEAIRNRMLRLPKLSISRFSYSGNTRTVERLLIFFSDVAAIDYLKETKLNASLKIPENEILVQEYLKATSRDNTTEKIINNVYYRKTVSTAEEDATLLKSIKTRLKNP